jgi:hypothetical protein
VSQTLSDSADLNERLARALARALVAELRAECRTDESPATGGTVQGSKENTNVHEQRTPTTA